MEGADERLVVMLEARITEFERRMRQAEQRGTRTYTGLRRDSAGATRQMEADAARAAARVNSSLASVSGRIGEFAKAYAGGLLAGGAAALVAGVGTAARAAVADMATLGDEAKRANLEVEDFQRWGFVASQNRIGIDSLVDGFKELSLRADEFIQTGAGPAAEAFGRLGLGAEELRDRLKDPSALMLEIIGRLEGMDKAAQVRIADEVFGGTGGERFVELLAQGEDGIRDTMARAEELGLVLDKSAIQKTAELDAKFREVEARVQSVWRTGVVEAGYFFGLIEREKEKLSLNPAEVGQTMGQGMADALAGLVEVPQEALVQLEGLRAEYIALGDEARNLVPALSDASTTLRGLNNEAGALALTDLAAQMADAAGAFEAGTITGEEYAARLREIAEEAGTTLDALGEIDRARFAGVIGQVSALLDWINALPAAAREARDEVAALALMDTGTGLTPGDDLLPPEPRSPLAPTRSSRPRRAPALLGEPDRPKPSGARSGGKAAGRVDALLADLETEREALERWYSESLEMLTAATDAELAQIGGRNEARERLEREHMDRLREIRSGGQDQMLAEAGTFFGAMAEVAALGGSRLVKAVRVFGALEAGANTLVAQSQVLRDPKLGWWGKLAAYASIGAAGARVVAALGGGGGGAGSAGAGASSSATDPAATGAQAEAQAPLRARLEAIDPAAMFQGRALIELFDAIQKEAGNRGVIWEAGQ